MNEPLFEKSNVLSIKIEIIDESRLPRLSDIETIKCFLTSSDVDRLRSFLIGNSLNTMEVK